MGGPQFNPACHIAVSLGAGGPVGRDAAGNFYRAGVFEVCRDPECRTTVVYCTCPACFPAFGGRAPSDASVTR